MVETFDGRLWREPNPRGDAHERMRRSRRSRPARRRAPSQAASGRFAALVALGILASRIAGLVRERALAHYFGNSDVADALKAAFRIPNLLQNLFGEGVLSASFIPVYARLLAEGDAAGGARAWRARSARRSRWR